MPISKRSFGKMSDGSETSLYVISNKSGMTIAVTDLGACLVSVKVPDGHGSFPDVALGYDGAAGYEHNSAFLGATVGRFANRIAGASFELGDKTYHLTANEGPNSVHSGPNFYFERLWAAEPNEADDSVTFTLTSPDGDQGFPGTLDISVTYTLTSDNKISVHHRAETSEPTLVNICNHSYWNLNGHASGEALDHVLSLTSPEYVEEDKACIPTGRILPVDGTPMDFRTPKPVSDAFHDEFCGFATLADHAGFDHCLMVPDTGGAVPFATLVGDQTGIRLEVSTDLPAFQLYSSNGLGANGKDGYEYCPYDAIVIESEFIPDSIHHPEWAQPVATPEHPFDSTTTFAFSTTK